MTKYFSQDTPLAGLERMMMSVPGFQKRGGGMMVLCRFHYKKEDVDCTYCRSYMRHTCQESVCPYIPERLEAGTIGYGVEVALTGIEPELLTCYDQAVADSQRSTHALEYFM